MKIEEKIEKLLSLAQSPNEHEARAALLKARELMAKNKINIKNIQKSSEKIINYITDISCTKMTNYWAVGLAKVIAEHYCCKSYTDREIGKKTMKIAFVGMEEDFVICVRIYRYAYKCVDRVCTKIKRKYKDRRTPEEIRNMVEAYGSGFIRGLAEAFEKQEKKNQEWGLVLAVPKEVLDFFHANTVTKKIQRKNYIDGNERFVRNGYRDGKRFEPSNKLNEKKIERE